MFKVKNKQGSVDEVMLPKKEHFWWECCSGLVTKKRLALIQQRHGLLQNIKDEMSMIRQLADTNEEVLNLASSILCQKHNLIR